MFLRLNPKIPFFLGTWMGGWPSRMCFSMFKFMVWAFLGCWLRNAKNVSDVSVDVSDVSEVLNRKFIKYRNICQLVLGKRLWIVWSYFSTPWGSNISPTHKFELYHEYTCFIVLQVFLCKWVLIYILHCPLHVIHIYCALPMYNVLENNSVFMFCTIDNQYTNVRLVSISSSCTYDISKCWSWQHYQMMMCLQEDLWNCLSMRTSCLFYWRLLYCNQ